MKRILTGIDAYNKMLTTPLPEKTKTYTPVSHMEVTNLVRRQLGFRGYKLLNEMYSSNQSGTVITVAFVFEYIDDPEISMSAVFVNSYDKTAKFQFKLGGLSKKHGTFVIPNGFAGSFLKRKHTGSAVDIINEHITESFNGITMVWDKLIEFKQQLQNFDIDTTGNASAYVLGRLMLDNAADSTQMSTVRENIAACTTASNKIMSLWDYYHLVASSISNTHPKLWHGSFSTLADVVGNVSSLYASAAAYPFAGPVLEAYNLMSIEEPEAVTQPEPEPEPTLLPF